MAEADSKKSKKRLVKNPESFRERALKASSEDAAKSSVIAKRASKLRAPFKLVGRGASKAFNRQPFRLLRKPLKILGKILFIGYFVQSFRELKLVTWPSWRESRRLTYAVLVFAIVFGASIALVDYGLDKLFKGLLLK